MFDIFDIVGITQLMEWGKEKREIESSPEAKPYHSEQIKPKTYSFRPRTLDEYIGQSRAKELVKINLQKIEKLKMVHFIISGSKGTGKSTLAYIIANSLDLPIMTYVAGSFTQENLMDFLHKNETSEYPAILFVDEIHGLDRNVGEFMYPILEDFLLPTGNLHVRPFIFIGATTDKNILQKKLAPMIDRCQAIINLEHYTSEDIAKILKQYNDQLYQKNISNEVYTLIGENCRYTPRISLALFEDFIICEDMQRVLNAHQIIKKSLVTNDLVVLSHLAEIDRPVGVEVMAIITQQTKADFMTLQEPFLISEGYISRTSRGRCITEKGKELLRSLNE